MTIKRLLPSLMCAALLSACAATGPGAGSLKSAGSIAPALADADVALKAGRTDQAFALLKSAGAAYPSDKAPWLRMAQLRFDAGNYGEAIVDALEALERDPDDMLAHSIVAVSGLRVSSKALADLTQKNNLSGTVRTEAQDLAKLLRTSLGEEVLVPGAGKNPARAAPARKPAVAGAPAPAAAPAPKASSGSDPFGALK
jgi:predicted Zn-dependent protease